jgi:hypothetical protein
MPKTRKLVSGDDDDDDVGEGEASAHVTGVEVVGT